MKNNILLILSLLMLTILLMAYCTAAPQAVAPKPAVQETVKKAEIQPPVIKDILGPKEAAILEDIYLTCLAIDPMGRKLTYTWAVDTGTIRGEGELGIWKTPEKPGSYTVSVKVTNDAGLEASQIKAFKVLAVPDSHKITDTTIYLNLSLTGNELVKAWASTRIMVTNEIQCSVANQEPAELNFKWNAPIGRLSGNNLAEGKASRVGWTAPGTPGQYTVGVTVTDKNGRGVMGEVNFEVIGDY